MSGRLPLDDVLAIAGSYARLKSSNADAKQHNGLDTQTAEFIK